jgi:hypothetical protein
MSLPDLLERHLSLCDELYQLTLDENRFLLRERRPPDEAARARKQALADRLEASLVALRALPLPPGSHGGSRLEQARERTLQILHLDRENEQLLLRCSLAAARPAPPPAPAASARKIYGQSHRAQRE